MIKDATLRESTKVYSKSTAISPMFQNIIHLVSVMINLIEWLVIYSYSVTVLDHILIILDKKHLAEQNGICFGRKSSNQIACLCSVGMIQPNSPNFADSIYKVYVAVIVIRHSMFQTLGMKLEWRYHFGSV